MVEIADNIAQNASVSEVSYDKPMIAKIHDNISKISVIILSVSGIFTLVAILLINSSIRLSVYSKRFIIKTMQLVGATKNFIRKPFILTNILLGIIGAILACSTLFICLYYANSYLPDLQLLNNKQNFGIVFGGLFLLGIFISWFSTFFAAQRFLNLHTDDLYI